MSPFSYGRVWIFPSGVTIGYSAGSTLCCPPAFSKNPYNPAARHPIFPGHLARRLLKDSRSAGRSKRSRCKAGETCPREGGGPGAQIEVRRDDSPGGFPRSARNKRRRWAFFIGLLHGHDLLRGRAHVMSRQFSFQVCECLVHVIEEPEDLQILLADGSCLDECMEV